MNHRPAILLASMLLALPFTGCSSDKDTAKPASTSEKPLTREETVEVTVKSRVKEVDQATRLMTLRDEAGHEVTFIVDRSVRRLNEVMAGDNVKATYRATLLAELRPPTAEESMNPIMVVGIGGKSQQGINPSAAGAQQIRVVTTVEAVDVPNMLVTLRGPMGDVSVVRARKVENIKKLHVGDTIVITYTESVAISLEKIAVR